MRFVLEQRMIDTSMALRMGFKAGWVKVREYNTRIGASKAASVKNRFARKSEMQFEYRSREQ